MIKAIQIGLPFNMIAWAVQGSVRIEVIPVTLQPPEDRGPGCLAMIIAAALLSVITPASLNAQAEAIHKLVESKPNVAAASLSSYLERVRAENSNIQESPDPSGPIVGGSPVWLQTCAPCGPMI